MSVASCVEFPAAPEPKSNLTRGLKLLLCSPAGDDYRNLNLLDGAEVCAVDVDSAEELSSAISTTAPDLVVLSLEALRRLLVSKTISSDSAEDLEYGLSGLCARHADIIRMIAKGLRNHEIANSLGMSSRTVKAILSSLYLRYDVTNRTELLGLLMEQGHMTSVLNKDQRVPERRSLLKPDKQLLAKKACSIAIWQKGRT